MATLADFYADPAQRARLPAGMRNNNPGNIKFVGQGRDRGVVGPSQNTDQGDPQAVFVSPEAGMTEMYRLLMRKYRGGKTSANAIIAGNGGWTPGNSQAAANVARSAGIGPDDDIGLADPARAARFMRGLISQEHGRSGDLYTDEMLRTAVAAGPGAVATNAGANNAALLSPAPLGRQAPRTPARSPSTGALLSPVPIGNQTPPAGSTSRPSQLGDAVAPQPEPEPAAPVFNFDLGSVLANWQARRAAEAQAHAADQQRRAALFGGDLYDFFR